MRLASVDNITIYYAPEKFFKLEGHTDVGHSYSKTFPATEHPEILDRAIRDFVVVPLACSTYFSHSLSPLLTEEIKMMLKQKISNHFNSTKVFVRVNKDDFFAKPRRN